VAESSELAADPQVQQELMATRADLAAVYAEYEKAGDLEACERVCCVRGR
jgi:hypothetical protein